MVVAAATVVLVVEVLAALGIVEVVLVVVDVLAGTVLNGIVVLVNELVVVGIDVVLDEPVLVEVVLVDELVVAGIEVVLVDELVVVGIEVVLVDELVVVGIDVVLDELVLVEVVVVGAQVGLVTVLESSVVEPLRARSRPATNAFEFAAIDVRAKMVPMNVDPTPRVAELPTCQNTLQAWAPLRSTMVLLGAVMSVDPAWKMKTASGSPWASNASVPVIANDDGDL